MLSFNFVFRLFLGGNFCVFFIMVVSLGYNDLDVVIVVVGRMLIGNLNGCFSLFKVYEFGVIVIWDVLKCGKILVFDVVEVIMG